MSSALEDTEAIIDTVLAQTQSDTDSDSEVVDTAQTSQEASSTDADLL